MIDHVPKSKAQNSSTYDFNQSTSPSSWTGSRGVQHVMQFLSRREWAFPDFCNPSLYDFFRYVKSLSSWKPSLVNLLQASFLASSSSLISDACSSSTGFHGGQWHHYLNCLTYLPCTFCTQLSCSLRILHETFDKDNTKTETMLSTTFARQP